MGFVQRGIQLIMDGTGRETECKLDLTADVALTHIPGWTLERRGTVQLRTIYWDTDDRRLARASHALRHRTTDGSAPHWTLKTTRAQQANLAVRDEHDEPGEVRRLPPRLLQALRAVLGDAGLQRIATIDVQRSITMLQRDGATIEMAEDRVTSSLGRRRGPSFDEVELELVRGRSADLADAHDALVALGASPSPWTSKLRRVLDDDAPPATPPTTVAQLVGSAIERALARLLRHDPALRLAPDDEAVHQARVATRRLRSDLRSMRPFLDPDVAVPLDAELSWLAGLLGAVRDLDVLALGFRHRRAAVDGDDEAWDELLNLVQAERAPHLSLVQQALDEARYLGLIEQLRALALAPPLSHDADPALDARTAAEVITARAWRRLQRGVRQLPHRPQDDDLHDVRKRSKQARYAYELVADISRRRVVRRIGPIEELQEVLGTLQDTVVARSWLDEHADQMSPSAAYLAGRLRTTNEHDAVALRAAFPDAWRTARRS